MNITPGESHVKVLKRHNCESLTAFWECQGIVCKLGEVKFHLTILLCSFRLVTKKQDYVETKQKVAQEIQTKNEFLNSLEPRLNSVLQVLLCTIT